LPEHLHEAYNWTDAAGELPELRDAEGDDLLAYVAASEANSAEHGERVTAVDLLTLHDWLLS
jgi:hypothetical protein